MVSEKRLKTTSKEEESSEGKSFQELGVDSRLVHALGKKGIHKPNPVQIFAIPQILEGKDVFAISKTGSGKTFAYLIPMLQKLLSNNVDRNKLAPNAFVLVPYNHLCIQVYMELLSLIELCKAQLKVTRINNDMKASELRAALTGPPDVLISTPACIVKCLTRGILQLEAINGSLETLVLDEVDHLLSFGHENDIKSILPHVPKSCQRLLTSATSSIGLNKMKKLILHNPFNLILRDEVIPKNIEQFWISCPASDKLLHILSVLTSEIVKKKVLIFSNTIDMSFKLKLFLEKFGIKSAVSHANLPHNSSYHILEEFNAGLFDYLIATDDIQSKEKDKAPNDVNCGSQKSRKYAGQKLYSESGIFRGLDFKHVDMVINFEMPQSVAEYVHRIGRTGRGYNFGSSISLVSPEEMDIFQEIRSFIADNENKGSNSIAEFPIAKDAVENLRYRVEDVARSVTKFAVREAKAQDLRDEILNSEKLKAHFERNPKDLDLLRHDKILSKNAPHYHLRYVPDYLLDKTNHEAREMPMLAIGNNKGRRLSKRKSREGGDPLKAVSAAAVSKILRKGIVKTRASPKKNECYLI